MGASKHSPDSAAGGHRRAAREAALQAVYQWQFVAGHADGLILEFEREGRLRGCDQEYFGLLVQGVLADVPGLQAVFDSYLDRPAVQLDPVERAILLLATFELRQRPELPHRVVLNEALELAKRFGGEGGHRYINGVLHPMAQSLRAAETGQRA